MVPPLGTGQVVRRTTGPGQLVPGKTGFSVGPVVRISDHSLDFLWDQLSEFPITQSRFSAVPLVRPAYFCRASCPA